VTRAVLAAKRPNTQQVLEHTGHSQEVSHSVTDDDNRLIMLE